MTVSQRIQQDFLTAFKTKQADTLSTLRLLKSALKNEEIDVRRPLTEEEVLAVVKSQLKQMTDGLESYQSAGRSDLVEKAEAEILVLEGYLPTQLSDEEVQSVVEAALKEANLTSKSQMGQAMGVAMKAADGRADGSRVRKVVEGLLVSLCLMGIALPAQAASSLSSTLTSVNEIQVSTLVLYALRFGRVALMLMGLMAILLIIKGAFQFTLSSGRSDDKNQAFQSMAGGMLATMFVTIIFTVATLVLEKMT